ncbi:thiosulfate/3-mercaptopyruvate sulfurtransferase [Burkholderiales bacterium]|nr:thiosulfate/3-mercaptopyruvate sulfurtransferase [Burkholderiales bacterium]
MRKLIAVLVGSMVMLFAQWAPAQGYVRPEMLIETEELASRLNDPTLRLIDAADPATYKRAHLPGAVNIPYLDLSRIDERRGSGHPTSNFEAERIFGEAGVDSNTQVVVYDGGEGAPATGVWFVLEFFGHKNVRVLNGGFRKWLKEGRPVTQELPVIARKKFTAAPQPEKIVTREWVKRKLGEKGIVFADTRSFNEFVGREQPAGAARGGHIPGAIHLEWSNFSAATASFRSAAEIEAELKKRGITPETLVVTYCQGGLGRSTDVAFAMKLIGWDKVVEYPGSWEEWSADPRLPLEK